jgi:hypothetical protein
LVPTPDEERVINAVVEAFEELNLMTDNLSSDQRPTVSAVLPMMRIIKGLLSKPLQYNEGRLYRTAVYDYIEEKYETCWRFALPVQMFMLCVRTNHSITCLSCYSSFLSLQLFCSNA